MVLRLRGEGALVVGEPPPPRRRNRRGKLPRGPRGRTPWRTPGGLPTGPPPATTRLLTAWTTFKALREGPQRPRRNSRTVARGDGGWGQRIRQAVQPTTRSRQPREVTDRLLRGRHRPAFPRRPWRRTCSLRWPSRPSSTSRSAAPVPTARRRLRGAARHRSAPRQRHLQAAGGGGLPSRYGAGHERGPSVHQPAPLVEQIASRATPLDSPADHVGKGHLRSAAHVRRLDRKR